MLSYLKDIQQGVSEKLPLAVYLKRTHTALSQEQNLQQLLASQGFQLAATFAWENLTEQEAKAVFVLLTSNVLSSNAPVFDVVIAENNWSKLLPFFRKEVQFFTNIAGAETFINGDSYGWHGISNAHFEAALAIVDDEKTLIFHVEE